MWLYILFLFIVFLVFILQFLLVYEDDGILNKVWAYRLFKFFQYGFRQDLNNVYDGKTKEQYEAEVNRVVEEIVSLAQKGKQYSSVYLSPEFNDKDTDIITNMVSKALRKRFNNVFSIESYYSRCNGSSYINVSWR